MPVEDYFENDDLGALWEGRITATPEVMVGKPCIAGTRITVECILEKLLSGWSFETILDQYPGLQRADVEAAIAYALDLVKRQIRLPTASVRA